MNSTDPNWRRGRSFVLALLVSAPALIGTAAADPASQFKPASAGVELDSRLTDMPGLRMGPFVRLADRRLLTVEDTMCQISNDEGQTWHGSRIFDDPSKFKISQERALLRTRKGAVIAAFMNNVEEHWTWDSKLGDAPGAVLPTYVMRSLDEGKTWQPPQKLHDDWTGAIRDILQTRRGRVIFTSMKLRHNPGRHSVITYASDDEGQSWRASNIIDMGGAGDHDGTIEATILELKDDRLLMLLRTSWMYFWRAESADGGLTWHPLGPSDIPASSSPGLLHRFDGGRIALIWNRAFPEGKESFPLTGGDRQRTATPASWFRGELSLAFSDDECRTWTKPVVIARSPKGLAYPYVFEAAPGELWITTMQGSLHAKLHEADFIQ
jgi:sialidase-1